MERTDEVIYQRAWLRTTQSVEQPTMLCFTGCAQDFEETDNKFKLFLKTFLTIVVEEIPVFNILNLLPGSCKKIIHEIQNRMLPGNPGNVHLLIAKNQRLPGVDPPAFILASLPSYRLCH